MDDSTKKLIQSHIDTNEICLFMKAPPDGRIKLLKSFFNRVTGFMNATSVFFFSMNEK